MKKLKPIPKKPVINRIIMHNTRGISGPMAQRVGSNTYVISSTYKKFTPP